MEDWTSLLVLVLLFSFGPGRVGKSTNRPLNIDNIGIITLTNNFCFYMGFMLDLSGLKYQHIYMIRDYYPYIFKMHVIVYLFPFLFQARPQNCQQLKNVHNKWLLNLKQRRKQKIPWGYRYTIAFFREIPPWKRNSIQSWNSKLLPVWAKELRMETKENKCLHRSINNWMLQAHLVHLLLFIGLSHSKSDTTTQQLPSHSSRLLRLSIIGARD